MKAERRVTPDQWAAHPPLRAFRQRCDRLAAFGKVKHGVADLLQPARSERDFQDAYRPMLDAVRMLKTPARRGDHQSRGAATPCKQ